jgi:hypothetical protein
VEALEMSRELNLRRVVRSTLYNLLSQSDELEAIINKRLFAGSAPMDAKPPYVVMGYLSGGQDNAAPSKAFDMRWVVCGVTEDDQITAENIAALITDILIDTTPPPIAGWEFYSPITELSIYDEQRVIQNAKFFYLGGTYRIRGSEINEEA